MPTPVFGVSAYCSAMAPRGAIWVSLGCLEHELSLDQRWMKGPWRGDYVVMGVLWYDGRGLWLYDRWPLSWRGDFHMMGPSGVKRGLWCEVNSHLLRRQWYANFCTCSLHSRLQCLMKFHSICLLFYIGYRISGTPVLFTLMLLKLISGNKGTRFVED